LQELLPLLLMTDGQRVEQVCLTLLSNAVKFSPEGASIAASGALIDLNKRALQPNCHIANGRLLLSLIICSL
jgi:signal transduction histidine kinase